MTNHSSEPRVLATLRPSINYCKHTGTNLRHRGTTLGGQDMDPHPTEPLGAPPVVAVVVVTDPGPWLEEALACLGRQDYPSLSVLVIDAASATDPTPRVAAALPGAYVRRLAEDPGFPAAANEVLSAVEGAAYFAVLHGDVAPDPDALRSEERRVRKERRPAGRPT